MQTSEVEVQEEFPPQVKAAIQSLVSTRQSSTSVFRNRLTNCIRTLTEWGAKQGEYTHSVNLKIQAEPQPPPTRTYDWTKIGLQLEKFDGDRKKAELYLSHVRAAVRLTPASLDEAAVYLVPGLLVGPAEDWWLFSGPFDNWGSFEEAFLEEYGPTKEEVLGKLQLDRQVHMEPFNPFASRIHRKCRELGIEEKRTVCTIIDRAYQVNHKVRKLLQEKYNDFTTVAELKDFVKEETQKLEPDDFD